MSAVLVYIYNTHYYITILGQSHNPNQASFSLWAESFICDYENQKPTINSFLRDYASLKVLKSTSFCWQTVIVSQSVIQSSQLGLGRTARKTSSWIVQFERWSRRRSYPRQKM